MIQTSISLVFFIVFIIYIFMGAFSLSINSKQLMNRMLFVICICFSIWSIAFSMVNSANTLEEALIWRRVSCLGWGVSYSIIFHFALILTKSSRVLSKKWVYFAIYLPSVFNVLFFGIYSGTAEKQYNLIHTTAGWVNLPLNDLGDAFFNFYYLLFSLLTLITLIFWFKKTKIANEKRYAIYIILTFILSFTLGTLTDSVANRILPFKIPSLAPIFILIPVLAFYFIIKNYSLLGSVPNRNFTPEGVILSSANRTILFHALSFGYVFCSLLILAFNLHTTGNWNSGILLSVILVIVSAIAYLFVYIPNSNRLQEYVLTFMLSAAIPVIMIFNNNKVIMNMVWVIPLFLFMFAIVISSKRMLAIMSSTGVIMLIWLWIEIPDMEVKLDSLTHFARLLCYLLGIMLTYFVSRIFISRLKENEKQVEFQKMISAISTSFVTVTADNFESKVMEMLKESAEYTLADRSYIALLSSDQKTVDFPYEWVRNSVSNTAKSSRVLDILNFDWYRNMVLDSGSIFISSVESLPAEAKNEKSMMLDEKIKSMLVIPIVIKNEVKGFIGFDHIIEQKGWKLEDNELLKILANIVGEAFAKLEVEKEINHLAYYDLLTGLPNRTLFNNRMEQAIHMARRSEKAIGLIFIDLDGFKAVNDTLGHDWGDDLLRQVGERLQSCIRRNDTVARFGGDEFLVMVTQISDNSTVEKIVNKIMGAFEKPVITSGQEFFITASAGIAIFPRDGEDTGILIKNADLAMYNAKNGGKNKYVFCSEDMKEDVIRKMKITNSLYRALERDELYLQYQPQLDIESKEIIGVEALVRWNNPEFGLIPPGIFIPIAEQTGLINPIGEWILETACRQCRVWQEMGIKPLQMAINISVEQFRNGNLLNVVMKCLKDADLEPKYLELEITEGVAMTETDIITKTIQELMEKGITISIDDFGVEYSSLSRFKDLPIDKLKIDMQFVRGISINEKDESIINVIIHLAKTLGIKVLAEGVETREQLDFLTSEECDEVQGYYFFKPMNKNDIEAILVKEVGI